LRQFAREVSILKNLAGHLLVDKGYTHARVVDEPEGQQYVALAPKHTGTGGFSLNAPKWKGSLRARYLGARSANADNSLVAEGYFLLDAQIAYLPKFNNGKQPLEITLSAQNIGNVAWKEAQFETETRLRDEPAPVTEIHFTPGAPFWLKAGMVFRF
jgi:outer membrane receptor protein involved in Fe transport